MRKLGILAASLCAIVALAWASSTWPFYEEGGVSAHVMLHEIIQRANAAGETEVVDLATECDNNGHASSPADPAHYDFVESALDAARNNDWVAVINELEHGGGG